MGKWDKDERRWDNEGRRGRKSPSGSEDDEEKMISVHETDLYDQGLMDIKKLTNEKNKAPANRHAIYDRAIDIIIDDLMEIAAGLNYPHDRFKQEIASALQGGKYKKLYNDPTNDSENDIVDIGRKKKISKPKPKRKPVKKVVKKVVKKCKCK